MHTVSSSVLRISPISHRGANSSAMPPTCLVISHSNETETRKPAGRSRENPIIFRHSLSKEASISCDRTWNNLQLWRKACFMLRTWVIFLPVIFFPRLGLSLLHLLVQTLSFPELYVPINDPKCTQLSRIFCALTTGKAYQLRPNCSLTGY